MGTYEQMEILKLQKDVHDIKHRLNMPVTTEPRRPSIAIQSAIAPIRPATATPVRSHTQTVVPEASLCQWCGKTAKLVTKLRIDGNPNKVINCSIPACKVCFNKFTRRMVALDE